MTIDTERIRDAAEVLDTLTSQLPAGHPLRADADARAKSCVAALYSAADALDAQQAEIDRHRRAAGRWKKVAESAEERVRDQAAEIERLRAALTAALKALDAISDEMTIGERYTNAGQYLIDALPIARAALSGEPK